MPTDAEDPPHRPGPRWHVQLLGGIHLRHGDIPLPSPAERAERVLFARLALRPRSAHGRDRLAAELWPDVPGADGREHPRADAIRLQRLRRVLSRLGTHFRHAGAVAPFVTTRDTLQLNADAFEIDALQFEQHMRAGRRAEARALYRGELLPGVADPWLDEERARLQALFDRPPPAEAAPGPENRHGAAAAPLVAHVSRFHGRHDEIEALRKALAQHRLVVLVGPGGSGKSRLAAELPRWLGGFERSIFGRLEECRTADAAFDALRAALGVQRQNRAAAELVVDRLRGRPVLLVLDNFEQLAGPAGHRIIDTLLRQLPELRLLVTSRRALRRADACVLPLPPLSVADAGATLAQARRHDAVALFVDRAQSARADFTLNARNLRGVIDVCRTVEGLPLAIELAAARIREFAPHQMAQALRQSTRLLARRQLRPGTPQRHASLEAALDWSWQLLPPQQREMLGLLAACRGGWTPAQAQALAPPQLPAAACIAALLGDSLLRAEPSAAAPSRLGLALPVREFVEARWTRAQRHTLPQRHLRVFLALARLARADGTLPDDADQPNFVHALAHACGAGAWPLACELAEALDGYWRTRGAAAQVPDWLALLARQPAVPPAQAVPLLTLLTTLLINGGRLAEAEGQARRALRRAGTDVALRAQALLVQAELLCRAPAGRADQARALSLVHQAQALLTRLPAGAAATLRLQARALLISGPLTLQHLRNLPAAVALFEEARRLLIAAGDPRAAVLALPGLTACLLHQGRHEEMIALARQGGADAYGLGDMTTHLQMFDRLAQAYGATADHASALQACCDQVARARRHGMDYYAMFGVWNACHPLASQGRCEEAIRLMAFASVQWQTRYKPLTPADRAYVREVRALAGPHLGAARLRREWARGAAWSLDEGLDFAERLAPGRLPDDDI